MEKLKISSLLKETGAFIFTYNQGLLFTKEGQVIKDQEKQKLFSDLLNEFKEKELMFEFLANAKKHLNSPKPSVGFFVREDNGVIEITRLCFIIGISMSMVPMESIDYKLFFNTFIDLEGKKIIVKDPVVKKV